MRLRGSVIGALNLFRTETGSMSDDDVAVAQALADVATIAILQNRAAVEAQEVNTQLTNALSSRIVIEQAKGMIAERQQLSIDEAFDRLRRHARRHNRRLADVAGDTVAGAHRPGGLHRARPLTAARCRRARQQRPPNGLGEAVRTVSIRRRRARLQMSHLFGSYCHQWTLPR